jgi:hypothetical protein
VGGRGDIHLRSGSGGAGGNGAAGDEKDGSCGNALSETTAAHPRSGAEGHARRLRMKWNHVA